MTTSTPVAEVLSRLKSPRSYSRGFTARCPAHDDRHDSLMIWEDEADGHAGLKCFADCTRKMICEALGLTEQDLYLPDEKRIKHAASPVLTVFDLSVDK